MSYRTELETLFREERNSFIGLFRKRGVRLELAEELVQDTFFQALRGESAFRGESSLKVYVVNIAQNLFKNHVRDNKAQKREGKNFSLDDDLNYFEPESSDQGAEAQLQIKQMRGIVADMIGELPEKMAEVMHLRHFQGRTLKEIAKILKVNIGTVKSQLSQGRNRLMTMGVRLEKVNRHEHQTMG